jgi:hypothetical protein
MKCDTFIAAVLAVGLVLVLVLSACKQGTRHERGRTGNAVTAPAEDRQQGQPTWQATELARKIAALDRSQLQSMTSEINSLRPRSDASEALAQYFDTIKNSDGVATAVAAFMAASGVETGDADQVQAALDNLIRTSGLSPGAEEFDFQIAMATRTAILSSPLSLGAYFVGRVVHHATAEATYEERMRSLARENPVIQQYRDVHGQWPSQYEIEKMRSLGGAYAIPEPRSTPAAQSNEVVKVERSGGPSGGTERVFIAPGATPEQIRNMQTQAQIEERNAQIQRNRQEGTQQVGRDVGRAATAAGQAASQAAAQVQRGLSGLLGGSQQSGQRKR